MERMKDKVAIVTGGGKGLGEATSLLFAKEGARVAVVDQIAEDAQRVAAAIREEGGNAFAVQADVSKSQDVQEMVGRVHAEYGRIDVLVNNAGIPGERHCPRVGGGTVGPSSRCQPQEPVSLLQVRHPLHANKQEGSNRLYFFDIGRLGTCWADRIQRVQARGNRSRPLHRI